MTTTTNPLDIAHFAGWLAMGERGVSSEAIVSRLTGYQVGTRWPGSTHPHDPSDFRRCQLLLEQYPIARLLFGAMKDVSPQWARLVDAWDEIHASSLAEVPDYLSPRSSGRAPLTLRLMDRIIHDGTVCASCDSTGQAAPCEKCKGTGRRGGGRCRACFSRGYVDCPTCRGRGFTPGAAS